MNSHPSRLLRSITVTGVTVMALGSLAPAPAAPPDDDLAPVASTIRKERDGACRVGPGEWSLKVRRLSRSRIRIDWHIDEVLRRQRWQVFIGVNGRRVAAVSRISNLSGEFQLEKVTRNRRGRDRVAASAVNPRTGAVCNARLRF
jgi:hypothetical protein